MEIVAARRPERRSCARFGSMPLLLFMRNVEDVNGRMLHPMRDVDNVGCAREGAVSRMTLGLGRARRIPNELVQIVH